MEAQKRAEYLRKKAAKLLIEICVVGLFLAVGALTAVLFCFGIRPYVVVTGSMEPSVHLGSVCFIDMAYPYNDVKAGDIIAYQKGELLVTHRVERALPNGLVTKGDAAPETDNAVVTQNNFGGKVIFIIPFVGYISILMKTNPSLCAAVILIVIVADYVIRAAVTAKENGTGQDDNEQQ